MNACFEGAASAVGHESCYEPCYSGLRYEKVSMHAAMRMPLAVRGALLDTNVLLDFFYPHEYPGRSSELYVDRIKADTLFVTNTSCEEFRNFMARATMRNGYELTVKKLWGNYDRYVHSEKTRDKVGRSRLIKISLGYFGGFRDYAGYLGQDSELIKIWDSERKNPGDISTLIDLTNFMVFRDTPCLQAFATGDSLFGKKYFRDVAESLGKEIIMTRGLAAIP